MNKYEEYEECLVPCRCGGKVELTGGTYGYPTFGIRCLKCGGQWSMDTYSPEEAAEKWGLKYVPLKVLKHWAEYFNKQEGQKYPCSNQTVVCYIVTDDRNKAISFIKDKNIVEKKETKNWIEWTLDNGERWIWRNLNEGCRGYRFYKMVVDRYIDADIFRYIVLPCCGNYCCSMEII